MSCAGAGQCADAMAGRSRVCAVLLDCTIVDVVNTERDVFGVAPDIGTTTVVAYLVNLVTGRTGNAESILNPQPAYGADPISRISFAETPGGLETLRREIAGAVDNLIKRLASASHVDSDQVCRNLTLFSPAALWSYAAFRAEEEQVCDALAASQTRLRAELASAIVKLMRHANRAKWVHSLASLFPRGNPAVARVKRLLDVPVANTGRSRWVYAVLALLSTGSVFIC